MRTATTGSLVQTLAGKELEQRGDRFGLICLDDCKLLKFLAFAWMDPNAGTSSPHALLWRPANCTRESAGGKWNIFRQMRIRILGNYRCHSQRMRRFNMMFVMRLTRTPVLAMTLSTWKRNWGLSVGIKALINLCLA